MELSEAHNMELTGLSVLNPHPSKLPGPSLLHHLVKPPNEFTAIEYLYGDKISSYSYHDLHFAADKLAITISQSCHDDGFQPIICLFLPQSPELYVAMLAVLKAGAAFCPLDVDLPTLRIKFILQDVSARAIIVSKASASQRFEEQGIPIIHFQGKHTASSYPLSPPRQSGPDDLAYIMYTSGSTGLPKGVAISHSAVSQSILAHHRQIPPFTRFLQFAIPRFDVSIFEIFFSLYRGSTLVSVRREEMLDDLPRVLRHMNVDACELTPSVMSSMLRKRQNAPKLKVLLSIGEMLKPPLLSEFGGSNERLSLLWAMYGPTEATIHWPVPAISATCSTGTIGTPLDTVSCFIIEPTHDSSSDGSFCILPQGAVGELAIGGHQLANGYINRPDLTIASFVTTVFGRVYRTGDRARLTSMGTIECLGRLDTGQIKLRGQRLELGEVEQTLFNIPTCRDVFAAVFDSNLVAFCVMEDTLDENTIRATLEQWLPKFMIPTEVILLPELPRLASGKVDSNMLGSLLHKPMRSTSISISRHGNLTRKEDIILQLCSNVLKQPLTENVKLAQMGLDSLTAIQLASAMRSMGLQIRVSQVMKSQTVRDLCSSANFRCRMISSTETNTNLSLFREKDQILKQYPALNEMRISIDDILPCTPLQSAMLAETARDAALYCNEIELQIPSPVALKEIEVAIYQLIDQNEILRTGFVQWRGRSVAIVFKRSNPAAVRQVSNFKRGFTMQRIEDFINPFRVQILCENNPNAPCLLLQCHHAVLDGWSVDLIIEELTSSLIFRNGHSLLRPQFRLVQQYFCSDQRKNDDDDAKLFWSEYLLDWKKASCPNLIAQAFQANVRRSVRQFWNIKPRIVNQAAAKRGVSAVTFFQGALAIVWSGFLGVRDIVLGSVTSGRTIPVDDIDRIIGPCIASLPLRVRFDMIHCFRELLDIIHSGTSSAVEHSSLSLREIKQLIGLRPSESLYDMLIVFQETLAARMISGGHVKVLRHDNYLETKILLEVTPTEGGYLLGITTSQDSFPTSFDEIFFKQLKDMFYALLENPHAVISSIQLNNHSPLSIFKPNSERLVETLDLAGGFETVAAKRLHETALMIQTSADQLGPPLLMTFEELNGIANQLARLLRDRVKKSGEVIALLMPKCKYLYVSILAVQKAECAYLPIIPSTPIARTWQIFRQADIKHCLTNTSTQIPFASSSLQDVTFLNVESVDLSSYTRRDLHRAPNPSRLAYVIFTSGTTASPKGVAVTQNNIISNVAHLQTIYPQPHGSQCRLLQACSPAFDVSVFEIFYAWHAGMCLCVAENDVLLSDLNGLIRHMEITHLCLTPTLASKVRPADVPKVEFLVTAGEPPTHQLIKRWGERLWQGYGPTETTNICTVKRMSYIDNPDHLGWVLPNTSALVLWPVCSQVVPLGWVGELCFAGDQVALGYLNESILTGRKFIQHPVVGRLFRSGDLGRMLPDGSLKILGRLDDQLKLRGQRIEVEEINDVISTSYTMAVDSARTILVQRRPNSEMQLATFFVPSCLRSDPNSMKAEVKNMLFAEFRSRLPLYMVPSYLIPIEEIPTTSSGKLDQECLREKFRSFSADESARSSFTNSITYYDKYLTKSEKKIAEVLSNICDLPMASVRRWSSFAAAGLDSLSAIDFSQALSSRLGIRVPISLILEHQSIAQLANALKIEASEHGKLPCQRSATIADLEEEVYKNWSHDHGIERVHPCTPLQEMMLMRGLDAFSNKMLLRFHIDSEQMREYWAKIVQRHGSLRTCFVTTKNTTYPIAQVVLRDWPFFWSEYDQPINSIARTTSVLMERLPQPLDSGIPPFLLTILRQNDAKFICIACHHVLYDFVAMRTILAEVEALANGYALPPVVPYQPFIQEVVRQPPDSDTFWHEHFKGFTTKPLFRRSSTRVINQCSHKCLLDISYSDLRCKLKSLCSSFLWACQAAWASLLAIIYDNPDVAFGNVVNGRHLALDGLHRLVAPCFNTIPIRVNTSTFLRNIEMLRFFQRTNSSMVKYYFSPLRRISRIVKGTNHNLHETVLLVQQPPQTLDQQIWSLEEDSGSMDAVFLCEITPSYQFNNVLIQLHYDMNIISKQAACAVTQLFQKIFLRTIELPFANLLNQNSLPVELVKMFSDFKRSENWTHYGGKSGDLFTENSEDVEQDVRIVFSELSGVPLPMVSKTTTLYQLGLDSINAVQIALALRKKGYKVSGQDVNRWPNLCELAQNLASHQFVSISSFDFKGFWAEVSAYVKLFVPPGSQIEAILPCTPMQNAMLASSIRSQGHLYLNLLTFEVDDSVSLTKLQESWGILQQRHPMLRTGFVSLERKDSPFAMVRYLPMSVDLPFENATESQFTFNLEKWQRSKREKFMGQISLPLWEVILVREARGISMHILMHHALYDAESMNKILEALSDIFRGKERFFPCVEPAINDILGQSLLIEIESKAFWQSLARSASVTKFPIMTTIKEPGRNFLEYEIFSVLSSHELRHGTSSIGVSVQTFIQSAWARILASYHGCSSVMFGVTLSNRYTEELEASPFPCINTVPVIASNSNNNKQMLVDMHQFNAKLHRYRYSPLSKIQTWLGQSKSYFDTLLVYQKNAERNFRKSPWTLVRDQAAVEYAVALELQHMDNHAIRLRISFADDVLPKAQAVLILRQFDAILAHLVKCPHQCESDLYGIKPDVFSVVPVISPRIEAPVECLHGFVERMALLHPHSVALEFAYSPLNVSSKSVWSYSDLNSMGNRVCHGLRTRIKPGNRVAIHFDKCPEAYFAILGILKAGCAFLALDISAPKARKAFILQDSKACCLLTDKRINIDFETSVDVVCVCKELLELYADKSSNLDLNTDPHSTCYCLYTSGTTGTPKGCEISHGNAVQAMMAFQKLFEGHWDTKSRFLQFAAFHFDVSVLEQYWSWSVGITVVAASKELILNDLSGSITKLEVTHIDITPTLARMIHPDQVPSLSRGILIIGGEQLQQAILDVWGSKALIYNAYGPTEATIGVTIFPSMPAHCRPSNIGWQFPNVGSYVLHPATENPILRGGVGELCLSGPLIGKGYLNRPHLTSKQFPYLSKFSERVYRTGDLVRLLHNGSFDFLGRADDQVKLRGQRLELGEIDHLIRSSISSLRDVATICVSRKADGEQALVSFLVKDCYASQSLEIMEDKDQLGREVRAVCSENLPGYMVPTFFLCVPFIPLSTNHKVDVKRLRTLLDQTSIRELMAFSRTVTHANNSDLRIKTYTKVSQLLSDFTSVDIDRISPSTSVFDIGIDSVNVLPLAASMKRQGLNLVSPSLILRNPIITDFVRVLLDKSSNISPMDRVLAAKQIVKGFKHKYGQFICRELGLEASEIEQIAPCSSVQDAILSRTTITHGAYFNTFELVMPNIVSIERIRRVWDELIENDSCLRSKFFKTAEGFIQAVIKRKERFWSDLIALSVEDVKPQVLESRQSWIMDNRGHIVRPLQLLCLTGPSFQRIFIQIFHALYDGRSLNLLIRQVAEIYLGNPIEKGPAFIDALTHGPLWNHDYCKDYWMEHLRGRRPTIGKLPIINPSDSSAIRVSKAIPTKHLKKSLCQKNFTLQSAVLAIWIFVLHKYLKIQLGITVGVVVAGTMLDLPNVQQTIGPLFNTLPFFISSLSTFSWSSLIRYCQKWSTETLSIQHTSLQSIQKWCSGNRLLFDNLFIFNIEMPCKDLPLVLTDFGNVLDFPLAFEASVTRTGDLHISLAVQNHHLDAELSERMLSEFECIATTLKIESDCSFLNEHSKHQKYSIEHLEGRESDSKDASGTTIQIDWNDQANILRHEVATLGGVSPEDVVEYTTLLDLGLDSIDAIKLSSRLSSRGLTLAATCIMQCHNFSELVKNIIIAQSPGSIFEEISNGSLSHNQMLIEQLISNSTLMEQVKKAGIKEEDVVHILPSTGLQEAMVARMIQSEFNTYFSQDVFEVNEGIDIERLRDAWHQVIEQSPILRTGFIEFDDPISDYVYLQVVLRHTSSKVRSMTLSNRSELWELMSTAKERAIIGGARTDLLQVFLAEAGRKCYVIVCIAHALYDGWSLSLMYRDLEAAYFGNEISRPSPEDFLSNILDPNEQAQSSVFWANALYETPPSLLPPRKGSDPSLGIHRKEITTHKSLANIDAFTKRLSVSLQALCAACWALVLAEQCSSLDVVFGMVVSNRQIANAQELMFPTMNTVAFRCILHDTVKNFLKYVEGHMVEMRRFQAFPLRKVQAKSQCQCLFNTLFLLQKSTPDLTTPNNLIKQFDSKSATEYAVCIEAQRAGKVLRWRITCQSKHCSERQSLMLLEKVDAVMTFLLESENSQVLAFEGSQVLICNLPKSVNHRPRQLSSRMKKGLSTDENENLHDVLISIRKTLSQISALPFDNVEPSCNLFHLGLDSLNAIKITSLLRTKGIYLSPREIVESNDIVQMAKRAKLSRESHQLTFDAPMFLSLPSDIDLDTLLAEISLTADMLDAVLPASPMQVHMLTTWQNAHGSIFFPTFHFRVTGETSEASVRKAWFSLLQRIPILRTRFVATGMEMVPWLQIVLKEPVPRTRLDWQPLVHFRITRSLKSSTLLIQIKIHHALFDALSLPAMTAQFATMLNGVNLLPTVSIQDWASYVTRPILKEARRNRRQFWCKFLGQHSSVPAEPWTKETIENRFSFFDPAAIHGPQVMELRKRASRHGVSLQSILLAAYAAEILHNPNLNSGQGESIIFGVYLANRMGDNDKAMRMFPTLQLIPLKVQFRSCKTLLDVAQTIQQDLTHIQGSGSEVGLWEIFRWTGIRIRSFVNFLRLPEVSEISPEAISITQMPNSDSFSSDIKFSSSFSNLCSKNSAKRNQVLDAYPVGRYFALDWWITQKLQN